MNIRRKNGYQRDRIRRRVLAAHSICHICKKPVDKTLNYLDDFAAEVDEIIPVSKGGNPLDWSNVALAHRVCNRRKSNHMKLHKTIAMPIKRSRQW
jgi:5-methylcytosine-specific restriction endonuclease McrA